MTQYFTDFSEYIVDATPSDWTARWVTSGVTWNVRDSGLPSGATGGKALQAVVSTDGRHLLSWDTPTSDADIEILVRYLRTGTVSAGSAFGVVARASGAAGSENAYLGGLIPITASNNPAIVEYVSGSAAVLAQGGESPVSANNWQLDRFRVNSNSLQGKYWADGVSEPGSYQVSTADSSHTAAGWIGIMAYQTTTWWIDYIGVGTDGDVAPSSQVGPESQVDSGVVGASESSSIFAVPSFGDSSQMGVSESSGLFVPLSALDNSQLAVSELESIGISSSDSDAVDVIEATDVAIIESVSGTDTDQLGSVESTALVIGVSSSDGGLIDEVEVSGLDIIDIYLLLPTYLRIIQDGYTLAMQDDGYSMTMIEDGLSITIVEE